MSPYFHSHRKEYNIVCGSDTERWGEKQKCELQKGEKSPWVGIQENQYLNTTHCLKERNSYYGMSYTKMKAGETTDS